MRTANLQTIALTAILLAPALPAPSQAAHRLRENHRLSGPVTKESDSPAGKFNKKIVGVPPAEAVKMIRGYNKQYRGKAAAAAAAKKPKRRSAFWESRRKRIYVSGRHFTPGTGLDTGLAAKAAGATSPDEEAVAIIQFSRESSQDETISMLELGLTYLGQTGHSAILARLPLSSVRELSQLDFIRWVGEYKEEYKYAPAPPENALSGTYITIFGDPGPEYEQQLAAIGVHVRGFSAAANSYIADLPYGDFPKVARFMWVRSLYYRLELTPRASNEYYEADDSRELVSAPDTWDISYTGENVVVGVYDTGILTDNTTDFPSGSVYPGSDLGDDVFGGESGHGSHVAGIIASRGGLEVPGEHNARGVAPGARIYMVRKGSNVDDAFAKWEAAGAQIANFSMGSSTYTYTEDTAAYDSDAAGKDMVMVFAAGNSGAAGIEHPALAKNLIAVGNINYAPSRIGTLDGSSSRGATQDSHRLKPELVAPGTEVISNAMEIDVGDWPEALSPYTKRTGTSQAAPHVSGALALFREWNGSFTGITEYVKAMLINTAIPIVTNSTIAAHGYANTNVGYGLANPFSMIYNYAGESNVFGGMGNVTPITNPDDNWTMDVPAGAKKLSVTMAYTDRSEGSNGDLIDNLDLELQPPGGAYSWGGFPEGVDGEGTIEKTVIEDPAAGTWGIKVYFKDYPSNPFNMKSQNYAVVAHVIMKTPELGVTTPSPVLYLNTGQSFIATMTITNTGGYIVAGATAGVTFSGNFTLNSSTPVFVGNLTHQLAAKTTVFHLVTPSAEGTYSLTLGAGAINKGLQGKSAGVSVVADGTPPTGSVSINEVSFTSSTVLHLTLSASDDRSGVAWMQFKNDGGSYGQWEDYAASKEWPIPSGDGLKKVWVKYKDRSGNMSEYSDQTTFDSQGPAGSMYINGSDVTLTSSTAVTLHHSASDIGSGVFQMQFKNGDAAAWSGTWDTYSGGSKAWTLPSGDGEKKVWVAYRDTALNVSSYSATITLDGSGPTSGSVSINSGAAKTNSCSVELSISASGAEQMRLSCDNSNWNDWQGYDTQISTTLPSGDGTKWIYVQFRDDAGNVTASSSDSIILDASGPSGAISIQNGAVYAYSTSVTLNLSASGATSMHFKDDGGAWGSWDPYSTSRSWTLPSGNGPKIVWVEFMDDAGNTAVYSDEIYLKVGGPDDAILIENGATYAWASRFNQTLNLNGAAVNAVDMQFSNDDSAWSGWESYSSTKVWDLADGADGSRTVWVNFRDASLITYKYSDTIILETEAPVKQTFNMNSNAAYTNEQTVALTISATDNLSGVKEMRFVNETPAGTWSTWEPYATSKEAWLLEPEEGQRKVYAQFRDHAGNETLMADSADFIKLDKSGPAGSISINSGAAHTNSTSATLTLSAADPQIGGYTGSGVSQMRFSSNGSSWTGWEAYGTSKAWTLASGDGAKTVWVQFNDSVGNVSTYSDSINLDTANPSGSIKINSGDSYTSSTTVTLTMAATDSGSGVAQMRFKENSGGTWSGWETYAAYRSFEMSSGDAIKWIYAQFKDGAGNTSTGDILDIIILDQTPPTGSISINSGAAYASGISATLTLSASDSQSTTMRLRNEDSSWSSWGSFSASKAHTLSVGEGTKTVTVEYRDSLGNAAAYSDTIILDTAAPSGLLLINNGSLYTNSASVTLSLVAEDTLSGVSQVKRNNEGEAWTTWYAYASTKSWTLAEGDGGKLVNIQYQDNAGNESAVFSSTITLDTTAPSSSHSLSPAAPDGVNNWYVSEVEVTLTGGDGAGSGIKLGYPHYKHNSSTETSGAFAFTVSTEGENTIEYWTLDNAGNEESSSHTFSFRVDASSPSSSVAALSLYSPASFAVSWSGTDATAGISSYTVQYMAEGGSWTDWFTDTALASGTFGPSSPVALQDQTTYYFRCLAKDHAGNTEQYPGSADAFTLVDVSSPPAPSITSSTHDEGVYNLTSNAPSFNWAVPADVSGIAGYSAVLDRSAGTVPGTTVNLAANSTSYTDLGDGTWYLHVRAADNAGNWGDADTYGPVKIDVTSPTFSGIAASPDPAKAGAAVISFTASEELSMATVTVTQNGASPMNVMMASSDNIGWSGTYTVTAGFDGTAQIDVEGMDVAGSTNTGSGNFTVDATAPSAPSASSSHPEDTPYSSGHASFSWAAASDSGGTGVAGYSYAVAQTATYTLDASTETEGLAASTDTADGTYWFHLAAVDNAGNLSEQDSYKFIVDTSSPAFTVSVSSDPARQTTITITVTASEVLAAAPATTVLQNGQGAPTALTMSSGDSVTWTGSYAVAAGFDGTAAISVSGQDPAGNTGPGSGNFEADTVAPSVSIAISSPSPLGTGSYQATLTITDASAIPAAPALTLTPQSTSAVQIALTGSDKTWQGSFFINPDTPEGMAAFAFSAVDAAGNTGTSITSGGTFTIETTVNIAAGGTIESQDGSRVDIPAGAAAEDLNIGIAALSAETPAIIDANTNSTDDLSVSPVQGAALYREFTATGDSSGQPVTAFQSALTITIPYPDADQDGLVDGAGARESELRVFYLNDVSHRWEMLPSYSADFSSNTLSASVNHFSIFSIMQVRPLAAALTGVIAYPNPCYLKTQSYLRIGGIPLSAAGARIYIYNIAGRLVRTLDESSGITVEAGSKVGKWDGKNSGGQKAASGVYIYLLKSSEGSKTEKFAVFW